jgi:hypothetical protein
MTSASQISPRQLLELAMRTLLIAMALNLLNWLLRELFSVTLPLTVVLIVGLAIWLPMTVGMFRTPRKIDT